ASIADPGARPSHGNRGPWPRCLLDEPPVPQPASGHVPPLLPQVGVVRRDREVAMSNASVASSPCLHVLRPQAAHGPSYLTLLPIPPGRCTRSASPAAAALPARPARHSPTLGHCGPR